MPEPFKNLLNKQLIGGIALHFRRVWPSFDDKNFIIDATNNLEQLELKERSVHISDVMKQYLPDDYNKTGSIFLSSLAPPILDDSFKASVELSGLSGWALMPMANYVGLHGQENFSLSMKLLKEITKRFSSEFAIRFFLLNHQEKTLAVLKIWTTDKSHHVRRLVSEGSRPRLPWAMQLSDFIKDPSPVIGLLEALKDDKKEYVRRSVANNLNDISKDHPELIVDIASRWMKDANKNRQRLVRHACRTLLKKGNQKALSIFGYNAIKLKLVQLDILTPGIRLGENLCFNFSVTSDSNYDQLLMIDYIIHHQKSNGKTSPKIFKWRSITISANKELLSTKKHPIVKISTLKYYSGIHKIEIIINGVLFAKANFTLAV